MLALWTDRMDLVRWGLTPVEIKSANEHVELSLSPGTDLSGRFVIPDGVSPVSLATTSVLFRPETLDLAEAMPTNAASKANPDGTFLAERLPWLRYRINVIGLRSSHYIKEIRYNHTPVNDGIISLSPGGTLEIILDDHPATLSGTILDGDKPAPTAVVLLQRRGSTGTVTQLAPPDMYAGMYAGNADANGHFQFIVAPGEYDIQASDSRNPRLRGQRPSGQSVKLDPGEQKTIEVKLAP